MFESALELMSETKVGNFEMKGSGGKAAGPPAPIKVRRLRGGWLLLLR